MLAAVIALVMAALLAFSVIGTEPHKANHESVEAMKRTEGSG